MATNKICFWMVVFHLISSVKSVCQSPSRIFDQVYQDEVFEMSSRMLLTTLNYTNRYDTFVPSQYMVMMLSVSGQSFSTSVAAGYNLTNLLSIMIVPAILFILGMLSLLFLNCGLLFRCCCFCCKCLPDFKPETGNEERIKKLKYDRTTTLVFFYFFCLVAFIADQLSFIGNSNITKGKVNCRIRI